MATSLKGGRMVLLVYGLVERQEDDAEALERLLFAEIKSRKNIA